MRAVAAIIHRSDDILLVRQQAPENPEPIWALPGGVVEPGEDLLSALQREIHEETGLALCEVKQLAWVVEVTDAAGGETLLAFIFEVSVGDGEFSPDDPDEFILDVRYLAVENAFRLVAKTLDVPSMSEPLLAYLSGNSTPGLIWFYQDSATGEQRLLRRISDSC